MTTPQSKACLKDMVANRDTRMRSGLVNLRGLLLASMLVIMPSVCLPQLTNSMALAAQEQGEDEFTRHISSNLLAADSAQTPEEAQKAYELALDAFRRLQNLADDGSTKAAAEIESFASQSITRDTLTSGLISALIKRYGALSANDDLALDVYVKILELTKSVEDIALKISAMVNLAHQVASVDPAIAKKGLLDAVELLEHLRDKEVKNAALNSIAQTANQIDQSITSPLVTRAIAGIWPARQRGYARYDQALTLLAETKIGKKAVAEADTDDITKASADAIKKGDLETALTLALAIGPSSSSARMKAVEKVLEEALSANRKDLLPVFATSLADRSDQEDLIKRIAMEHVKSDRLLEALKITADMKPGPALSEINFILASAFEKAGLSKIGADTYARGLEIVDTLAGDEKQGALITAIDGANDLKRHEDALRLLSSLTALREASNVLGNLGKAIADTGDVTNAEKVLSLTNDRNDKDKILSGIGRTKVRAGDVQGGLQIIAEITDDSDKGRVQSEIARVWAREGAIAKATDLADTIQDDDYRVEAYLRVAAQIKNKASSSDFAGLINRAVDTAAEMSKVKDRDNAYLDIVETLVKADDFKLARSLVDRIENQKTRTKAVAIISEKKAAAGELNEALDYLNSFADLTNNESVRADTLVAGAAHDKLLKQIVFSIQELKDPMVRVRASRKVAEARLLALDSYDLRMGKMSTVDYAPDGEQAAITTAAATSPATPLPSPIFSDGHMTLSLLPADDRSGAKRYGYPDLSQASVEKIREMIPAPRKGSVAVTLANLMPYQSKFLEDLDEGKTAVGYAAAAQKLVYPRVIVVEHGVYTLGQIAEELSIYSGFDLLHVEQDTITLRAPIFVNPDATLTLSGQEAKTYKLSATAGAFITVAGDLFIHDTVVTSWDEETNSPRHSDKKKRKIFRPFITGWSNSNIYIGGTVLDSLGYAASKSFGLSFSAGPKAAVRNLGKVSPPSGIIADNYFHNFEYGFYSYEAKDVAIVGNEYRDNVLYAIDPHDRSKRLLIGLNTTYDTQAKHGIIISREVDYSWIVGNVTYHNTGSGLMIDRNSVSNFIYGNTSFENDQDGLTFFESSCNLSAANHLFDNKRSGVKIRNSWEIGVYDNRIEGNVQAGIEGYLSELENSAGSKYRDFELDPYVPLTTFAALGNTISGNRDGITLRDVSGASLAGNKFIGQSGRLLSGDARAFEGHVLRYSADNTVAISSAACRPSNPINHTCRFRLESVFDADGQNAFFGAPGTKTCLGISSSNS